MLLTSRDRLFVHTILSFDTNGKRVNSLLNFCPTRYGFYHFYRHTLLRVAFCASVCKGIAFDGSLNQFYELFSNCVTILRTMRAVLSLCLLALSGALAADNCFQDVSQQCAQNSMGLLMASCNAVYGEYGRHGNVASEMQAYANLHLERSFEYLLSAAYYNNYMRNRAGFTKLFKKLSDDAWEKTIDIIKHVTLRGGEMNFAQRSTQKPVERKNYTAEVYELQALAKALDTQKEIAERAFYIHREATRNSQHLHDPEIAQYLEEEFVEDQAKRIRDLAGHTKDLKRFIEANNGQDLSLALYLFDEYLQKTA